MSRRPNARLLSDFDLNSGMMRFLLNLRNEYSVIDAVEHSLQIDENLWPNWLTSIDQLDVFARRPGESNLRIESTQIRNLVEFMRRNYERWLHLSGNLERYLMG